MHLPPRDQATRLVLVRHLQPDESVTGRAYGTLDVPLSSGAREQAQELAHALEHMQFAAVYTSPLRRALDTAIPIAARHGLEPVAHDGLRELDFGAFEGERYEDLATRDPATFHAWMSEPTRVTFPRGESFSDLRVRAIAAAEEIRARHAGSCIAVVAHGGVTRAILAETLVMAVAALFRLDQPHGAVSVIDWLDATPVVRLINANLIGSARPILAAVKRPERTAVILTVGNEIVSGDVENTNASWLARRLAGLGVEVKLIAAVRDDVDEIAAFLRLESPRASLVFVTGGLGGTPDDITREGVAAAFELPCEEIAAVAAPLRKRFAPRGLADYAARWACLPRGAEPLDNPLGGAPGFVLENVFVFPGLPREMEAMFDSVADRFRGPAISTWRRSYRTGEGQIVAVLEEATRRHPGVSVGSYPRFLPDGPEVEVVLKSSDDEALSEASSWVERALEEVSSRAG